VDTIADMADAAAAAAAAAAAVDVAAGMKHEATVMKVHD